MQVYGGNRKLSLVPPPLVPTGFGPKDPNRLQSRLVPSSLLCFQDIGLMDPKLCIGQEFSRLLMD